MSQVAMQASSCVLRASYQQATMCCERRQCEQPSVAKLNQCEQPCAASYTKASNRALRATSQRMGAPPH
eukprot:2340842-Alexandrium_andersonii.AAC.1